MELVVGGNAQKFRIKRGLTIVDLSKDVGIGRGYYSDIEKGLRNTTEEVILSIAKELDIPPHWLFLPNVDRELHSLN